MSDAALMRAMDDCGAAGCPDAAVRLDVFQRLCGIRDAYSRDVETATTAWRDRCVRLQVPADDKSGGWPDDQHFTYVKVVKEVASRGRGQDRKTLLDRLAIELPAVPRHAADVHDQWYKAKRQHQAVLRDLAQRAARQQSEELDRGRTLFDKAVADHEEDLRAAEEAERREIEQRTKHTKLQRLRKVKVSRGGGGERGVLRR